MATTKKSNIYGGKCSPSPWQNEFSIYWTLAHTRFPQPERRDYLLSWDPPLCLGKLLAEYTTLFSGLAKGGYAAFLAR